MAKFWIDGSGWNGKESKFTIVKDDGQIWQHRVAEKKTNNEMEYLALIEAMKLANSEDTIITDSMLLVGQLTQGWKVKAVNLWPLWQSAYAGVQLLRIHLQWCPRKANRAGWLQERR